MKLPDGDHVRGLGITSLLESMTPGEYINPTLEPLDASRVRSFDELPPRLFPNHMLFDNYYLNETYMAEGSVLDMAYHLIY